MARVLVRGASLMGPAIGRDLLDNRMADRVTVVNIDPRQEAVGRLDPERCQGGCLDTTSVSACTLREMMALRNCLPSVRAATET